jgi:hypothetical protein
VHDATINESDGVRVVHAGMRVEATLKGQVGDDAKVQYVDLNASTVSERGGTDVPISVRRKRVQLRFVPSRDEFYPGLPTEIVGVSATGWDTAGADQYEADMESNFLAGLMLWAGVNYLEAEDE